MPKSPTLLTRAVFGNSWPKLFQIAQPDCTGRWIPPAMRSSHCPSIKGSAPPVVDRLGTELLNGKLSDERLDFYEAIQTMDPLVANLRTAMPETQHVAEAVNTLISMIRSHDALGECDMTLPKNARTNALLRRLMRGVDAIRAPAPPFTPPPSLRFVGSIGELRQIGRKFENCLTRMDHYAMRLWFGLADGSMVFLVHDESCLLIALRQVGRNVWHIEEVDGPTVIPKSARQLKLRSRRLASTSSAWTLCMHCGSCKRSENGDRKAATTNLAMSPTVNWLLARYRWQSGPTSTGRTTE